MRKFMTIGELEAASPEEQRADAKRWVAEMEAAYWREVARDDELDRRAFARGHGDLDPGPGQKSGQYSRSGTTRDSGL